MSDLPLSPTGANSQDSQSPAESRAAIRLRAQAFCFLRRAFGFSLVTTFGIIFLQGFHLWGFQLSDAFLNWLGGATVGQVAGLFAMVVKRDKAN
jgi:hypothetical protein